MDSKIICSLLLQICKLSLAGIEYDQDYLNNRDLLAFYRLGLSYLLKHNWKPLHLALVGLIVNK